MMRIVTCDKAEHVRNLLTVWIREWMAAEGIDAECYTVADPEELEYEFEAGGAADLVFAELGYDNAADRTNILRRLKEKYPAMDVVLVSGNRLPYRMLFALRPIYCLEKPLEREELINIMRIYTKERGAAKFHFRYNRIYYAIPVDHIIYIYHFKRKIEICCIGGKNFECYMRMEEAEERITASDRMFLRIRDSCMVNLKRLECFSAESVLMENGTELKVSRTHAASALIRYSAYFRAITGEEDKSYK